MEKNLTIHNSTAEFLIFQAHDKSQGMEVVYHDDTIWATQKAMSVLFDCSTDNFGLHLKNIFASGEQKKESVTEKISATASDGKKYQTQFYNLDAIISVGYCVNSIRAPSSAVVTQSWTPPATSPQTMPMNLLKPNSRKTASSRTDFSSPISTG